MDKNEFEKKYAELKKRLVERKKKLADDTGATFLFGGITSLLTGADIVLARAVYDLLMKTGISNSPGFFAKNSPLLFSIVLGLHGVIPILEPLSQFIEHMGYVHDDLANIHDTKQKIKQLKRNDT